MLTMNCDNCKYIDKCEDEMFIKLAGTNIEVDYCLNHEFQNTSKDCVHFNVCKKHKCLDCEFIGVSECEEFKERSLHYQLPCRFGEQLYLIRTAVNSDKKRIGKATVLNYRNLGYVIENFNKTIFTKEIAEKLIKELNQ